MKLIDKVVALASAKGITHADLAKVALVPPTRISDWKKDEGKQITENVLKETLEIFGVTG